MNENRDRKKSRQKMAKTRQSTVKNAKITAKSQHKFTWHHITSPKTILYSV